MTRDFIKRGFDFLASGAGLVVLSPLFAIISLLIKIDSSGPVFFKQKRAGKNGKIFDILKFRTMFDKNDNYTVSQIRGFELNGNDPRITKFGDFLRRSGLDEMPQLINILKGEMSVVGPRPYFLARFENNEAISERLKLKPGLTSLAVVKGGVSLSEEDILMYDLEYIKRQNFWLDMEIFVRTIILYLKRIIWRKDLKNG